MFNLKKHTLLCRKKADKKRKLYNGTLKVDLYQYFGERVKRQIKA